MIFSAFSRPMIETSQAVIVVPMLAPITTPMACLSVISPALAKPTTITVVALLLWIRQVTAQPTSTAMGMLRVTARSILRSLSPAARFRPSLMMRMPNRKRPSPPTTMKTMSSLVSGVTAVH